MSGPARTDDALSLGGVPLDRAFAALRTLEPAAHACWIYDLDGFAERARRFLAAFAGLAPMVAYALKANALPALIERAHAAGLGADAVSLGELELARAAGVPPGDCVLNGNGRTREEADWAARERIHSVNADSIAELDVLEAAAARSGATLRVALRVNPGIEGGTHRYVETGIEEAKFGVAPGEALAAWAARARWPHLALDGLHLHIGSQLFDPAPLVRAGEAALALADEAARRGAPLGFVNLGGGFGVDYSDQRREFPLDRLARALGELAAGRSLGWVLEPGRWLVAPIGVLLAEVLAVKERNGHRFVVLGAGMNDLIRPALYGARHRIVPVRERGAPSRPAQVVGPVCESADEFSGDAALPPLAPGELVAILDAGAYGASMSSNYNARGRLAELTVSGGRLARARRGEGIEDLLARRTNDPLC